MKREELAELGLEKETINAVMALHGTTVNDLKSQVNTLEMEKDQLSNQVEQYSNQLEELKDNSGDSELKERINQLEADNQALKDSQADELANLKRQHKIQLTVKGLGVKDEEYIASKLADLEVDEEGNLKDLDSRVNELKEAHPLLFESQEPEQPRKWSQGNSTVNSTGLTKQDIMNEKNASKRQELIANNPQLFK